MCGRAGRCLIIIVNAAMMAVAVAFFVSQAFLLLRSGVYFRSLGFIIAVTIAAAIIIVLFFGCLAACFDHKVMIWLYAVLMGAFFALTVYVFVSYSLKFHDHQQVEEEIKSFYAEYGKEPNGEKTKLIDDLQIYLSCCGSSSFRQDLPSGKLPYSCCNQEDRLIPKNNLPATRTYAYREETVLAKANTSVVDEEDKSTKINRVFTFLESTNQLFCEESAAKTTHGLGCIEKIKKIEPYLFYSTAVLIVVSALGVLGGICAGLEFDDYGYGRRYR